MLRDIDENQGKPYINQQQPRMDSSRNSSSYKSATRGGFLEATRQEERRSFLQGNGEKKSRFKRFYMWQKQR
jgi:hypothetical protein